MNQAEAFLSGIGDEYYNRNIADFGRIDPVSDVIEQLKLKPKSVLEVGCANGWRLRKLRERYGCKVRGVEPSEKAVQAADDLLGPGWVLQSTADKLVFFPDSFDLVIFGFCLWLCEPGSWFKIASEADQVLRNGGYLIIHDFVPARPFKYLYAPEHASADERKMWGWLYDHAKLWAAHPFYKIIAESAQYKTLTASNVMVMESVTVLQKNSERSFPEMVTGGFLR